MWRAYSGDEASRVASGPASRPRSVAPRRRRRSTIMIPAWIATRPRCQGMVSSGESLYAVLTKHAFSLV
jgi:hypothetical protein